MLPFPVAMSPREAPISSKAFAAETLPPKGSPRRAAAIDRMIARLDGKDGVAFERVRALGEEAFTPLLRTVLALPEESTGEHDPSTQLSALLAAAFRRGRTGELLAALERLPLGSSWRLTLLEILGDDGDLSRAAPVLIRLLGSPEDPAPDWEGYNRNRALRPLALSPRPEARDYLARWIAAQRPDDGPALRLWSRIAGGDRKALAEARAMKRGREPLSPLVTRMNLGTTGPGEISEPLASRTDGKGVTWGLVRSSVLGRDGDLWILRRRGARWERPLYTGLALADPYAQKPEPPPTLDGRTGDDLARGDWFTVLVGSPALSRDHDGDGLTDLVEARLGTDPDRADTDGDGTRDGIDPMPTAPWRRLNDREAVLSAAFEAMTRRPPGTFWVLPGVSHLTVPASIRPFEVPALDGPLLWWTPERFRDSRWSFAGGTVLFDLDGLGATGPVTFNRDRTAARVGYSWRGAPLAGEGDEIRLRKFGGEWFVVETSIEWVT